MRKIWLRNGTLDEDKNQKYLDVYQNFANRTEQLRVQTFKFFGF